MARASDTGQSRRRWGLWARWLIGIGTGVVAVSVSVLVVALGHCSAFGGTCPAEPVPLLEDDVFGTVAAVVGLATAVVGVCSRPTRRGVTTALLVALPVGVLAGLLAANGARG